MSKFLSVHGYVHLILEDGAKLTAQDGIRLLSGSGSSNADATLTIYAQSQGESMGQIIATGKENFSGIFVHTDSTLTINGGYVKATGGSKGGAGIGGRASRAGDIMYDCGTVIINGGVVIAQGSDGGSGIGGGIMLENASGGINYGGQGGDLTINGGLVTAIGGENHGKAIGYGYGSDKPLYEGTLTLGKRIAVYNDDSKKDVQLKGTDTEIFNQIIGTLGGNNQIQRVVFETHGDYGIVASDKYALPTGKLSMTADGEFGDFKYLRLDNKKLPDTAYTTQPGSTVATVNLSGRNLSPDTTHSLSFIYPNGSADGEFTVVLQLPTPTPAADLSQVPQTGDRSSLLLWAALAVACGVVVIAVVARRRK